MSALIPALLAVALLAAGCVTTWTRIEQPVVSGPENRFRVEAPPVWVRFSFNQDRITITRDGLPIQFMEAARLAGDKAFPKSKKTLPTDALPAEVAALQLAELRAFPAMADLGVRENTPRTEAGLPGFRVVVQYRNERAARVDRLIYGARQGTEVLLFSYQALDTYYFARDVPTFEQFVASYKATGP